MKFPKRLSPQTAEMIESIELSRLPEIFESAACSGISPDLFQSEHPSRISRAKAICAACPIRTSCLEWALQHPEEGVWGGLTKRERVQVSSIPSTEVLDQLAERREKRLRLLANVPIATLAAEFQVTERTIHRWRVRILKEAS